MAEPTFDDPFFHRPGFVHFIAAGETAVKIGTSSLDSFEDRLRALQTSNHEQLEVIGVIPFLDGDKPMRRAEERQVGYEWFSWAEELLDFIRDHTEPPEKFELPRSVAKRRCDS